MAHQPTTQASKGAAEEPPPEPDDSTTASYDPIVFQRPHPDDRGGADGSKPRKKGGGEGAGKAGAQSKGEVKGNGNGNGIRKGKKGGLSLDRCGWCDTEGASRTCSQCRSVVYCSPACQKVSRT